MKRTLYQSVHNIGQRHPNLFVVVSDLGSFSDFQKDFPTRYINVGVTEPNAVSISAGIASEGKTVLLYSVAGFTIYRGYEQIKFAVGYWNQPVHIIGTGFGWRFHQVGRGHHPVDDIMLMRSIPNLNVYTPATTSKLSDIINQLPKGPSYIRIGEEDYENWIPFNPNLEESELLILGLGEIAHQCLAAARQFSSRKIFVEAVEDFLDTTICSIINKCRSVKKVMVVEDHGRIGGLGDILYHNLIAFEHIHLPLNIDMITKTKEEMLHYYGFTVEKIASRIKEVL